MLTVGESLIAVNKRSNRFDQVLRRFRPTTGTHFDLVKSVKLAKQSCLVHGQHDSAVSSKPVCGRNLMVRCMLPQRGQPWHDHEGLIELEGGDDGPDAGMGDHGVGFQKGLMKFRRIKHLGPSYVLRLVTALADLSENVFPLPRTGPFVDRTDQAIER
jgi:hypothetical protein